MNTASYDQRRGQIEHYFDRVAPQTWARLTSDAPVSGIRATVRAGRDRMRATLLEWLPADLHGARVLDAGCGTGALAVEAARRGAEVVAIDISPTLVALARERAPAELVNATQGPRISFGAGDMLDPALGRFDHVVAMDSLIHYEPADVVRALARLAERTSRSMVFTHAPRTPLLAAMHAVGKLFPRSDRSPAIVPVHEGRLWQLKQAEPALAAFRAQRSLRVNSSFYISQAEELVRP
jgi:magnesium-protoporphyrin O-methyltransferase